MTINSNREGSPGHRTPAGWAGLRVAGRTLEEWAAYVTRCPDILDPILSLWNAFDLQGLTAFLADVDFEQSYESPDPRHGRYKESRETIRRLMSGRDFSSADRGYLPRDHARQVYSATAQAYDGVWDSVWTYENRQAVIGALDPKAGETLLEVGIGTGNNLKHLPPGVKVTGIDFSPRMLEVCRRKASELGRDPERLLEMDAHALDLPDNEFDKVLCFYSLCAVENPFQVLREIARVLRPGGRLVIYDVVRSDLPEVALLQYLYRPIARELGAIYLEFCPPGNITYDACLDVAKPVREAGLKTVAVSYLDPFRTVLLGVYEKPA